MERARGPRAEAGSPDDEEEEATAGTAMAAVVAGGAGPAVLQVAGLYRGLCTVRSRTLSPGFVSAAQLRVFPVRSGSGRPAGGANDSGVGAELEANPYYDRYRDKIQRLRRCGPRVGRGRAGPRHIPATRGSGSVPTLQMMRLGCCAKVTQLSPAEPWLFPQSPVFALRWPQDSPVRQVAKSTVPTIREGTCSRSRAESTKPRAQSWGSQTPSQRPRMSG